MSKYDTTEKIERTDVGFRVTVESTRGTGTRDQDKVKCELRTESLPTVPEWEWMNEQVTNLMDKRRAHRPDGDDDV